MTQGMARVIERVSMAAIDPGNRLLADYLSETHAPELGGARDAAVSAALVEYQQHLGADDAAVTAARRLASSSVPVVTVGQQPGLLLGPLYTPLKALTAISLARKLGGVAVFWVGNDDDDRAEVDHCACWDAYGRLHALRYPEDAGAPGQLVGDLPVGAAGARVVDALRPLLAGMPHADYALGLAEETLADSADFGDWFARLLAQLFGPLGLVVCDPRLPELRRLAMPVLQREIAKPLLTTRMVNLGASLLRGQSYTPVLTKPNELCNFFYFDGRRHRVTYEYERYYTAGQAFTLAEMTGLLQADPGCLLPNAVLRPVVQEALFASAAFVAGPNEMAYWQELPGVFTALEVPQPPVVVRAGATVLTAETAAALRELGLPPQLLLHHFDAVRLERLAAAQPPALAGAFTDARLEVDRLAATLAEEMGRLDATLAASVQASHQKMLNEVERLEHKALKAIERRTGEVSARLERLRETLFPGRGLLERTLTVFALLARVGPDWPTMWCDLLAGQEGQHLFVEL